MMETRRGVELRAVPGRRLLGRAMHYGREAGVTLPDGRPVVERFAAFAFAEYLRSGAATLLNLEHDQTLTIASTAGETRARGALVIRDHPDGLDLEARLPSGDVFDSVLDLVRDGSTAELSVEFRALNERMAGDRRTVLQATLPAIGVVRAGAYRGGIEVRARGRGLAGRVPYDTPRVTRDRGDVRKEEFAAGAFDFTLRDPGREVLLQIGDDAGQVLGSKRAGTLRLRDTPEALTFDVETLPDTTYARDLRALLADGTIAPGVLPLFRRPPADVVPNATELREDPDAPGVRIERINSAVLTALSLRYRAPRGNPGVVEARALPVTRNHQAGRWWL